MERGLFRRVTGRVGAILLVGLVAGCGTASGDPQGPPVPTFPAPSVAASSAAASAEQVGRLPDDCGRLLATGDLGALFGLPLDSVTARTTLGIPSPTVGRTERMTCDYTGNAAPARGPLLQLNVSSFTDGDAAAKQWRTNADAEYGARRDLPIGTARAVLVERPAEALLMIVSGTETLTVVLPGRSVPAPAARADRAVDLALRILAKITPGGSGPPPPPTTRPPVAGSAP